MHVDQLIAETQNLGQYGEESDRVTVIETRMG